MSYGFERIYPAVKQHNINRYKDGLAPATLINNPIGSQPFKNRIPNGSNQNSN